MRGNKPYSAPQNEVPSGDNPKMKFALRKRNTFALSDIGLWLDSKRKCPKCSKVKPVTEYYEYDTGGNTHTYWCKECIEYYIKHTSVGAN